MKYVVKCPYCEHSYIIEENDNFQCDNCGAQNGMGDVVERIEEPVVVEKVKTVVVEKEVIKTVPVKEDVDPDLQTIKNFDLSRYNFDEKDTPANTGSPFSIWIIGVIIFALSVGLLSIKPKEDDKPSPQSRVYVYYPENKTESGQEKKQPITVEGYGLDDELALVWEMEHMNEAPVTQQETPTSQQDKSVASDVIIRTAQNGSWETEKSSEEESAILFMNGIRVDRPYVEMQDEDGQMYGRYRFAELSKGEYVFSVKTRLGDLSMQCEVTKDNQEIVLDALQVGEETRNKIAADLLDIWNQVDALALDHEDEDKLRPYFHTTVTDKEIRELISQINREHSVLGDYEDAYLTDLKISDDYFYAIDYNTFIVSVEADYRIDDKDHPSGTGNSKIAIINTGDGWKIYENYNNAFFTLADRDVEEER